MAKFVYSKQSLLFPLEIKHATKYELSELMTTVNLHTDVHGIESKT